MSRIPARKLTPFEELDRQIGALSEKEWRAIVQTMRRMFEYDRLDLRKIPPVIRSYMGGEVTLASWIELRDALTRARRRRSRETKAREEAAILRDRRLHKRLYMNEYRKRVAKSKGDTI